MDNLLVQTIDEMLKEKLPTKSSMSSAEWTIAYPQSTQTLACNGSNIYRFSLPKYPNGYLCATKGGLNPFFQFTLSAFSAANVLSKFRAEPWAIFQQIKIFLNGVQITDVQYSNHVYAEWLKKKTAEWLSTDGNNFGMSETLTPFSGLPPSQAAADAASGVKYTLPLPDNFSIFSKNHAIPLSAVDIVMEVTLNDFGRFVTGLVNDLTAPQALTSVEVSNLSLMLPICHVDPEVDRAIMSKLEAGDMDENEMFLLPIENIRVDSQSHNFPVGTSTKNFIWNTVSSSVRFLEAVISIDQNNSALASYKTTTKLNPGVKNYIYRIDGKNVTQTNVTTNQGGYDQAYQLRNDLASAYNYVNNEQAYQMGSINKSRFNSLATTNPAVGDAGGTPLASSFAAVAILDTVSRDNVIGGTKTINNLQLELQSESVGGLPNTNVYLIQHSNAVVAFSKTKCKLLM